MVIMVIKWLMGKWFVFLIFCPLPYLITKGYFRKQPLLVVLGIAVVLDDETRHVRKKSFWRLSPCHFICHQSFSLWLCRKCDGTLW